MKRSTPLNKWLAPSFVVLAGAIIFAAVQLSVTQAAQPDVIETTTPTPVETAPSPAEPTPPGATPELGATPVPLEPEPVVLPTATTVLDAVVVGLGTACSSANSTVTNKANWTLWDPNAANYLGYWEVSANSVSGLVVLHVYPEDGVVSIHPYTPFPEEAMVDATQAFAEWGCPNVIYVAKG